MSLHLPDQISAFVAALVVLQSPPTSVWLIGSRANGRATEQSDTDLIVFGSEDLLNAAKTSLGQPHGVDCLIVYNGDDYQDPWQEKSGSLSEIKWESIDASNAKYVGTKWVPDEESSAEFGADMGDRVERKERAIRLWP